MCCRHSKAIVHFIEEEYTCSFSTDTMLWSPACYDLLFSFSVRVFPHILFINMIIIWVNSLSPLFLAQAFAIRVFLGYSFHLNNLLSVIFANSLLINLKMYRFVQNAITDFLDSCTNYALASSSSKK